MPHSERTRPAGGAERKVPPRESPFPFEQALLFTGHMIDSPGRTPERFPASAEPRARHAIHSAVANVAWTQPGTMVGLAGAASGGDILFHECCRELGIPTRVLLAMPPEEFEAISVAPAGSAWVARFHRLVAGAGPALHVMRETDGLIEGATDSVWQRANLWMIEEAGRLAPERALLALWDGEAGDGPGGTEYFLRAAARSGIRILPPIEMRTLLQPNAKVG